MIHPPRLKFSLRRWAHVGPLQEGRYWDWLLIFRLGPQTLTGVRIDQKPGSNMHKTNGFPWESELSLMKFVREGGRGYTLQTREKGRNRAPASPGGAFRFRNRRENWRLFYSSFEAAITTTLLVALGSSETVKVSCAIFKSEVLLPTTITRAWKVPL